MKQYVFYVEGLGLTLTILGSSPRKAMLGVWANLTEDQKDAVVSIEHIDTLDIEGGDNQISW